MPTIKDDEQKKPTLKNKKIALMHQLHLTIYLQNTSLPVIELYLYITKKLKFPYSMKGYLSRSFSPQQ